MRVTNSMMVRSSLNDLNRSLSRLQSDQTRLSSGRAISRPADDPSGAGSAMSMRKQLRQMEQHERAITDAQGWLGTADAAILSGLDVMNRVKELAVRAGNNGAATDGARQSLAIEIGQLRGELLSLANTEYLGRPIFNGTAAGSAYDPSGAYLGNDATVIRDVAPNTTVQANLTGPEVFGDPTSPEGDVFAMLDRLEAAITAGDTAGITLEHQRLDGARDQMSSAAAQVGVRGSRLEAVRERRAADEVMVREALSQIEDTDIAEALISVKASENAYTAALQAAGRVMPQSLVDFMR